MSDKPLASKLMIKEGRTVLLVGAPRGYRKMLEPLPARTRFLQEPSPPVDIVQVFCQNRQDLETQLPPLKHVIAPGGMIWVTYYKGTSDHKTDINRDTINAYAHTLGLEGVAMISIDQDWSALRLKVAT